MSGLGGVGRGGKIAFAAQEATKRKIKTENMLPVIKEKLDA